MKKIKEIVGKLTPKNLVNDSCPNCKTKVPSGEPFWCPRCKQALNYPSKTKLNNI